MTLAEATALKNEYRVCLSKILKNQSYTIAETTYTYANIKYVQEQFDKYDKLVSRLGGSGGMRVRRVVPRDD